MASRSIRNTTGSDIFLDDVGILIPAGETYEIPASDLLVWLRSVDGGDAEPLIDGGDLVVADSAGDLSADTGKSFLRIDPVQIQIDGVPLSGGVKVINFVGATGSTGTATATVDVQSVSAVSEKNFSYRETAAGETIEIPSKQQMTVHGCTIIEGELDIEGQLVVEI